jgi:hypothetical protein
MITRRMPTASDVPRFPLVEDRAKGLRLLAVMILGRALRDIVVPARNQIGSGVYVGALVGVLLYIMARPGVTRTRALVWAVLGGLATTVVVAV